MITRAGMELMARGRLCSGLAVSAAAVPAISMPWNEKMAIWKPATNPMNPVGKKPPRFHRWAMLAGGAPATGGWKEVMAR